MESNKPILIVPSGILTAEEKKSAQDAGYVVIITDEPEKVKIITPISSMDGLDILNAAIIGLDKGYDNGRQAFVKELANRVTSKTSIK